MPIQTLDAVVTGPISGKKFPPNSVVERILGIEQVLDPITGAVVEVAVKKKCIPTDASGALMMQRAWDADWLPADEEHAVMKAYAADALKATKAAHTKECDDLTKECDEALKQAEADKLALEALRQKVAELEREIEALKAKVPADAT